MIESCGWKGFREGDAGVAPSHALVLVNHGNASGAELLALARRISASVLEKFGVPIEPGPPARRTVVNTPALSPAPRCGRRC